MENHFFTSIYNGIIADLKLQIQYIIFNIDYFSRNYTYKLLCLSCVEIMCRLFLSFEFLTKNI